MSSAQTYDKRNTKVIYKLAFKVITNSKTTASKYSFKQNSKNSTILYKSE